MFPLSRSLWLAALAVFIAYASPSSAASKTEAAKERAEGEKQSIEKKLSTLREELSSKERQSKEASRRIQKADQAISNFTNKEDLKILGEDIRFINSKEIKLHPKGYFFYGSIGYWLFYIVPALGFVFLLLLYLAFWSESKYG